MKYFKTNPPSLEEIYKWNDNKLINPRTNRKITPNSNIYKLFQKLYSSQNNIFNITLVDNNYEPIIYQQLWELKLNKRVPLVDEKEYIVYQENDKRYQAFHYLSLIGLKEANITTHPITKKIIPQDVFDKAFTIQNNSSKNTIIKKETLENYALRVFQKFNNLTIFIDHNEYLKISDCKIKKIIFELSSFIDSNLSISQKSFIKKELFKNNTKKDLLQDIEYLIDYSYKTDKIIIAYIIVAALALVMPKLKKDYSFLEYSF